MKCKIYNLDIRKPLGDGVLGLKEKITKASESSNYFAMRYGEEIINNQAMMNRIHDESLPCMRLTKLNDGNVLIK